VTHGVTGLTTLTGLTGLAGLAALTGLAGLGLVVALAGCGAADPSTQVTPVAQLLSSAAAVGRPPTAAAGRLVPGFPTEVPVPAGAHVTASAVEDRGELLAVSVTGTSRQPVAGLLAFFRARLTRAGFTATDDSLLPAGASGAAFGRSGGTEMLIVAVIDRGTERSFSIGGTVERH
jgi:hypothetical protein